MARDEQRIEALAARVARLEDELAIHAALVRYGLAVDVGDADAVAAIFAEDALIDIDGAHFYRGRDEIRQKLVLGPGHQRLLPNCAHTMGPLLVQLDGDRAEASGYARIYLKQGDAIEMFRFGFIRWRFARIDGRWQATDRISRSLGSAGAHEVFRQALAGHG